MYRFDNGEFIVWQVKRDAGWSNNEVVIQKETKKKGIFKAIY